MGRIIPYEDLKNLLMREYRYSAEEAAYTVARLRKADPETLRGFEVFYHTGELPEERIHGVRVGDLVKARGLNPVAAFLAVAWLGSSPLRARFHLMYPVMSRRPDAQVLEHIREVAERKGWDLSAPREPEDTSDLVLPEDPGEED